MSRCINPPTRSSPLTLPVVKLAEVVLLYEIPVVYVGFGFLRDGRELHFMSATAVCPSLIHVIDFIVSAKCVQYLVFPSESKLIFPVKCALFFNDGLCQCLGFFKLLWIVVAVVLAAEIQYRN